MTSVVFSKSGWDLITGGRDKVAIVWDLHNNKKKRTVTVFDPIESLSLIPAFLCTFIEKEEYKKSSNNFWI